MLSFCPPLQLPLPCWGLNETQIVQGSKDWPRTGEVHHLGSLDSKPGGLCPCPDSLKGYQWDLSPFEVSVYPL